MSFGCDTSTCSAEATRLPARIESPDSVEALVTAAFLEQAIPPGTYVERGATFDRLVYVRGSTRSGSAVETLKGFLDAVDLPSLRFLSGQGQHKFETENDLTEVSVLDPSSLRRVASDLRKLLERVKGEPLLAIKADFDGSFEVEEVEKALSRDYVSPKPALDLNVRGDEGQGADYFFTWLRSILRVVEGAISEGRAVIHVMKVP